jgi:hypothetical protein
MPPSHLALSSGNLSGSSFLQGPAHTLQLYSLALKLLDQLVSVHQSKAQVLHLLFSLGPISLGNLSFI